MLSDEEYLKEAKKFFTRKQTGVDKLFVEMLSARGGDAEYIRKTYPIGYITLPDGRTIRQNSDGEPYFAEE